MQITNNLNLRDADGTAMGLNFEWRRWIREGIADQMLTKYISPFSPVFRDIREETKKAGLPFYVEFERHFHLPDAPAIYRNYFDTARRAKADAVNIYEAANVACINDSGETYSKTPPFTEFLRNYPHRRMKKK